MEVQRDRLGRPLTRAATSEFHLGVEPPNKGEIYPAEIYTDEEIGRLLSAALYFRKSGLRNRSIVTTMWRAGLRIAEALALEPRDIDLVTGDLLVRRGKGAKRRALALDDQALEVIEQWLAVRNGELGYPARRGPLFTVVNNRMGRGPVSYTTFREGLQAAADRADIAKRVHCHGFRHTFAVNLMREGNPVTVIQKALGHGDLQTTARYLDHLMPAEVIDALRKRHWPTAATAGLTLLTGHEQRMHPATAEQLELEFAAAA